MDHIDKDEELVCPLCGGRVLWMPVSRIYVCEHCKQSYSEVNGVYLRKERKATAEKPSAGGDAAKLREALDYCRDMVADLIHHIGHDEDYLEREMKELVAKCNTALALPRRNCEVGTEHEQHERFKRYCDNYGRYSNGDPKCDGCQLCMRAVKEGGKCEFMWGQMPYEEKEGGAV